MQVVLNDRTAPTEIAYPVDVPAGGTIVASADGALAVTSKEGVVLGGIAAPWARDARGGEVATHYDVRGTTVVQVIDHRAAGLAYPVVADPWLGQNLIASAKWVGAGRQWTLQVVPTQWARINAGGFLVGAAGWDELYAKYKNVGRGIRNNLAGMRDQFICHEQFVAIRTPNKPSWNLDEWRPNVGYPQTVAHQCNPGPNGSPELVSRPVVRRGAPVRARVVR